MHEENNEYNEEPKKHSSIEKNLEKLFCLRIVEEEGMAIKLVPISALGLPDRLVLRKGGRVCFVEFKDEGLPLRPNQERMRKRLVQLGFEYYLINSYTTLNAFFNRPAEISDIWG